MTETEVVLVGHATAVPPTPEGPDEFQRPLAPEGLRQAFDLAEPLTGLYPAAVWSSPYRRAVQTVEPTADALRLRIRTRWELREWDHALPPTADPARHTARSWAESHYARPGGESLDQLTTRAVTAVRGLLALHPGRRVLVGSHGTFVSRALCGFGLPVDWAFSRDMPVPAVYRLRFTGPASMPRIVGPGL